MSLCKKIKKATAKEIRKKVEKARKTVVLCKLRKNYAKNYKSKKHQKKHQKPINVVDCKERKVLRKKRQKNPS